LNCQFEWWCCINAYLTQTNLCKCWVFCFRPWVTGDTLSILCVDWKYSHLKFSHMKLQELAQLLNFTWIKIKDCVKAGCLSKALKVLFQVSHCSFVELLAFVSSIKSLKRRFEVLLSIVWDNTEKDSFLFSLIKACRFSCQIFATCGKCLL